MNIEPERYELREGPLYDFTIGRREFLGLVVFVLLPAAAEAQRETGGRRGGGAQPREISAWIHIGEDGTITAYTGKVEVGQNARTSFTQAVAEELRVAPGAIRVVMGDTALVPFDMGTFGSQSTPNMFPQLRRAAAAARATLLSAAAEQWNTDASRLTVRDGKVWSDAKSVSFGELTHGKKMLQAIDASVKLRTPDEWTIAGTSLPKVNGRDIVTGRHQYASDRQPPGLLHGRVLRAPAFEAKLTALEPGDLPAGARLVRDGDFAGVTAPDATGAAAALAGLKAQWDTKPQTNDRDVYEHLVKTARQPNTVHAAGDFDSAFPQRGGFARTYRVAYIAHTPLEPRAAVAEWKDGKLTVWTGTQRPFGVRDELVQTFGLQPGDVRVLMPDTGSGYGGKHSGECAIEAARLAREAGRPVKVVWTREEEFTWAYFRPAGVIEVKAALDESGRLKAWAYRNYNSGTAGIRTPYDVANQRIEFCESESPLRQGSYRGLAATANHFARESAMDELANLQSADPVEFRLRNTKDERLRAVLTAAAEKFRWGNPGSSPVGVACGTEKGSYVATVVEIAPGPPIRVKRAVTAFECGPVVNPEQLRNQVEGSVIMGIGGALFEKIRFENGRILNGRIGRYRVPRFADTPVLETVLVNRRDLPMIGAGETPIVAIAPAIANALERATGQRRRAMPLDEPAS